MPDTYTLLEKVTVGAAGASSITFTNIPQSYNDLVIRMSGRTTYGSNIGDNITVTANGNAITTVRSVYGAGSGNIASVLDPFITAAALATANTFNNGEFLFSNYSGSIAKSVLFDGVVENNATAAFQFITSGMFTSTSPITSITMAGQAGGSSWVQGSTFYLYGVTRLNVTPLSAPKATGGDIIQTDGTYWYHAFLSSSTFRPLTSLSCDVLVVAGGGGSGRTGGGGGAGGLRSLTGQALSATNYTVTIGGGGTGSTLDGGVATNGSTSTFHTTNASGGGGGASFNNSGNGNGAAGGSGGGGGTSDGSTSFTRLGGAGNAGSYSPAEGNSGGNGNNARGSGGGGGAGVAGSSAPSSNTGGAGGNGSSSFSSWGLATGTGQNISGTVWFAGGGGGSGLSTGGAAGNGGAGAGGILNSGAKNATANTGGGAGSNNDMNGYAGGSGIVIVRYAV